MAGAEVFLCVVIIETVIETGTVTGNGSGNGNEIEIEIATSGTLEMGSIIAANQIAIGAGGTVTSMPEIPASALAAPVHPRETFVTFVTPAAAMAVTSRGCVAILEIAWCLPHQIQRMVTPQGLGILRGGLLTESVVGETGKEGGVVVGVPTWTIETPFDAEVDPGTAGGSGSGIEAETETATGTGTETFGIAIANVIGTEIEIEIESIIGTATLTVAIALIDERTTGALSGMTVSGRWTRRSEIGRQIEMKAITCPPLHPPPPLRPLPP